MEKTDSPATGNTVSTSKRSSALSVVIAGVGSLVVICLTGYLTMQLQLSEIHAVLGLDGRAVGVPGDWLPYVWRLCLILVGLAAVLTYRLLVDGKPARLVALALMTVAALWATPLASGGPRAGEEQYPLLVYILIEGAKSPLVLALIGAVLAGLVGSRSKRRAE